MQSVVRQDLLSVDPIQVPFVGSDETEDQVFRSVRSKLSAQAGSLRNRTRSIKAVVC